MIKNYILLVTVKRLEIPYKPKENLYPLVTILKNPISYKNKVIYIKTKLLKLKIKRQKVVINFNILLLGNNKAVLEILCRLKKNLYLLVIILGNLIFYKNRVIRIKIKLLELRIKG